MAGEVLAGGLRPKEIIADHGRRLFADKTVRMPLIDAMLSDSTLLREQDEMIGALEVMRSDLIQKQKISPEPGLKRIDDDIVRLKAKTGLEN
ncbi:Uncharacterised protein [uncultured archaeon]|nr:Uncharacterised protein [uncultured archaeon]